MAGGLLIDRRQMVAAGFGVLAACLARPALAVLGSELRNSRAFNARGLASVFNALDLPAPEPSAAIRIDAPDIAENGANVPVEIAVDLPGVERILVIGERNLFPLLADVGISPRATPWVELRVKLADSSPLLVLAHASGKVYSARRSVRVIVGGCLPG